MAEKIEPAKVKIDGTEYSLDDMSEAAKAQFANIQFVDAQIQQLNNEWAVADTARIDRAIDKHHEFRRIGWGIGSCGCGHGGHFLRAGSAA